MGANPPGTEAEVVVSRNGERKTFEVTLDALEADEDGNVVASTQGESRSNTLGLSVEAISEDRRDYRRGRG